MLILSRKRDQDIVIGAGENQVVVRVIEIRGDKVRLGIEAPKHVPVHRREVAELIKRESLIKQESASHMKGSNHASSFISEIASSQSGQPSRP